MIGFKRKIEETKFRLNLRKTLANQTIELLKITLEETKKEIERRNTKHGH